MSLSAQPEACPARSCVPSATGAALALFRIPSHLALPETVPLYCSTPFRGGGVAQLRWNANARGVYRGRPVTRADEEELTMSNLTQRLSPGNRNPPLSGAPGHLSGRSSTEPAARPARPDLFPAPSCAGVAFHGLAGDLVRVIEPHSEGDPVGILIQALVAFGSCIGRTAHFIVEQDVHYLNLFCVLVGVSSKGRKGSSWSRVRRLFGGVDPEWEKDRVKSGVVSGEGVIWAVRDAIEKEEPIKEKRRVVGYQTVRVDRGVADKRLLCYEPEFASVLKLAEREGNTTSTTLRQAWDRGDLETLAKNNPARATAAHISIIGHITAEELRRYLSATEQANGFGNRFLWLLVKRSKSLPEGGSPEPGALADLAAEFQEAARFARSVGEVGFDVGGRALWHSVYAELSEGKPGLWGAMTARAEAQVRRLACLYALLDRSPQVGDLHLRAALALWAYAEESVRLVFGDALGDGVADEILRLLRSSPRGQTREEIRNYFSGHKRSPDISRALALLESCRLAHCVMEATNGRSAERWFAGPEPAR